MWYFAWKPELVADIFWLMVGLKESWVVSFKDGICAKLFLMLCFERYWYFWNITESGWFWKRLSREKVSNNNFLIIQSENAIVQRPIANLWTVISNRVIKHQLTHTRFYQITDLKHDICFHRKLPRNLISASG